MKINSLMLFSYNFPHKKTQDFILRLISEGYKIKYVMAAPKIKLNIPPNSVKLSPQYNNLIHPKKICLALGIKFIVCKHSSDRCIKYLAQNPVDAYIIAGARILPEKVINVCKKRIINIHPGLLPEMRGLDTILWSIKEDIPLGISAHFINARIDSGILICKKVLKLCQSDSIVEASQKLLEKQPDVLIQALSLLNTRRPKLHTLEFRNDHYHSKMPPEEEIKTVNKYSKWLKNTYK